MKIITKAVFLKGKNSGIQAYMEYKTKSDLPLNLWEKDFDIQFVKWIEEEV